MRSKSALLFVGLVASLVAGVTFGDCYSYSNSQIVYYGGQAYCGGYGSGCTECTDGGGGSCVTNGTDCTPRPVNKSA